MLRLTCHLHLSSHPADAAVGTAPLVHGEVFNGLTYRSLALLQPCALTVQLTAEPLAAGGDAAQAPALQLVPAPGADQPQQAQQAAAAYSRFPALPVSLAQPLAVTLTVTNHGRTIPGGSSAAAAGATSPSSASGEPLELQLDAALACQPVRGSEQEEAAAGAAQELSAVWAGQLWTGLSLRVAPGQSASQRLGLCLLAPGLYRLTLQHWQCRPVGPAAAALQQAQEQRAGRKHAPPAPLLNTMAAVEPCFVLASQ